MKMRLNCLEKILVGTFVQTAICIPICAQAGIIFQDNFEEQSSTWNIGKGSLATPSGQSGTWGYWDRESCSSYPCGKCDQLPAQADGWMTFIDFSGGRNGGKAVKWVNADACKLASNSYQGTIKWNPPNNTTKEIYWGAYWKFDPDFKMAGNNGCKIGHRVWWWDSSEAKEDLWMSISDMRFQGNSDWKLYSSYNQTTYNHVVAAPDSSKYYDGNWHWFEFHFKLNSTHTTNDGVLEVWMDGTKYVNLQNQNFTSFNAPSGSHTGWYIREVQTLLGDCQIQPYDFNNTTWKGFMIDDFMVSTTYIGPTYTLKPSNDTLTTPTNLEIK